MLHEFSLKCWHARKIQGWFLKNLEFTTTTYSRFSYANAEVNTKFVVVKCAEFSVLNTCIVCSPSLLRPTCHGMHSKLTAFEKFVQVLEFQDFQFFVNFVWSFILRSCKTCPHNRNGLKIDHNMKMYVAFWKRHLFLNFVT